MVTSESLGRLLTAEPKEAWAEVFALLWLGLSAPVTEKDVAAEMVRRDRSFEALAGRGKKAVHEQVVVILSGSKWSGLRGSDARIRRTQRGSVQLCEL